VQYPTTITGRDCQAAGYALIEPAILAPVVVEKFRIEPLKDRIITAHHGHEFGDADAEDHLVRSQKS
jgi:hypothetical protein